MVLAVKDFVSVDLSSIFSEKESPTDSLLLMKGMGKCSSTVDNNNDMLLELGMEKRSSHYKLSVTCTICTD